jgi:SAM-dependent methyltransferase
MRSPGRYVGLDIDTNRLADARDRFARYPNFTFVDADIRNLGYNPRGALDASMYVFPFDRNEFDVIYAASLFTHLLPLETSNYLQQCARVLKPNGRCLFSFFLRDYFRGSGTTISPLYDFSHQLPSSDGAYVRDLKHPDAAIAYTLEWIGRAAKGAGLTIERILPGLWSEGPGWASNEQDLLVLRHSTGADSPPLVGFSRSE